MLNNLPSRQQASIPHWIKAYSLTIVLSFAFVTLWAGQAVAGWRVFSKDCLRDHPRTVSFIEYLSTGHFLEATAENWESEFLQMGAFIWLTAFLFQKGSPESNDPDRPKTSRPITRDSPWPMKRGRLAGAIYSYSLTIAFAVMFLISIVLHAIGGRIECNRERLTHGETALSTLQFAATSQFWFESLQNWQSEFLAIAVMVVLGTLLGSWKSLTPS